MYWDDCREHGLGEEKGSDKDETRRLHMQRDPSARYQGVMKTMMFLVRVEVLVLDCSLMLNLRA